jgi:hypothetical protein
MPRQAPLRTSSPSHPQLDSSEGEWHSQWYQATRNVAQRQNHAQYCKAIIDTLH